MCTGCTGLRLQAFRYRVSGLRRLLERGKVSQAAALGIEGLGLGEVETWKAKAYGLAVRLVLILGQLLKPKS